MWVTWWCHNGTKDTWSTTGFPWFSDTTPLSLLKGSGPSLVAVEISALTREGGGASELVRAFLLMIDSMLSSGRDFDLAQGYLALFLKVSQSQHSKHTSPGLVLVDPDLVLPGHDLVLPGLLSVFCPKSLLFFFPRTTLGSCHVTLSPWSHCSASRLVWRLCGRSFGPHSTNHYAFCHLPRAPCFSSFVSVMSTFGIVE